MTFSVKYSSVTVPSQAVVSFIHIQVMVLLYVQVPVKGFLCVHSKLFALPADSVIPQGFPLLHGPRSIVSAVWQLDAVAESQFGSAAFKLGTKESAAMVNNTPIILLGVFILFAVFVCLFVQLQNKKYNWS